MRFMKPFVLLLPFTFTTVEPEEVAEVVVDAEEAATVMGGTNAILPLDVIIKPP